MFLCATELRYMAHTVALGDMFLRLHEHAL